MPQPPGGGPCAVGASIATFLGVNAVRKARITGLAVSALLIGTGLPALGVMAQAAQADAGNLYVDNGSATCSDAGADAGSQAVPFCTISAAAKVVEPGQTVRIAAGKYPESVEITRSGTPEAPITFTGPGYEKTAVPGAVVIGIQQDLLHAVSFKGVHDVTFEHFTPKSGQEAVLVTDSGRITVNDAWIQSSGWKSVTGGVTYPAVRVTGQSSDVTVSRSRVAMTPGDAISIDPGVVRAVVSTNQMVTNIGRAVAVTDAPGTVVTSNTIGPNCGAGVELAGNSSGSTVENNVLLKLSGRAPQGCSSSQYLTLAVSAASTSGTTADYNVVTSDAPNAYGWADHTYGGIPAFQQASGQGAHDVAVPRAFMTPQEGSPMIDSADANAPGQLDTDLHGSPRVDDPVVADTGTGAGHHDRGAFEFQDPMALTYNVTPKAGQAPLDVTVTGAATATWVPITQYSVDFGDGSAQVISETLPVGHTYPAPGTYKVAVTATNALGHTATVLQSHVVAPPAPVAAHLAVRSGTDGMPLRVTADPSATVSPWPVASYSYDFGDGTPVTDNPVHTYAAVGTYVVTLTVKDDHDRTAASLQQVTAGSAFVPVLSARLLDTRSGNGAPAGSVGPRGVVQVPVTGRAGVPANGHVTAVLLNITATEPTTGGFVTAYSGATSRPTASSLNFTAGQTVANAVLVPVGPDGKVALYNGAGGRVQLLADVVGYYADVVGNPAAGGFHSLPSAGPVRLLDTRNGTGAPKGKLGPGGTVRLKVRGAAGVPAGANAVTLNLTATDSVGGGFVSAAPTSIPPTTSSLNFSTGQIVSNQVTVPIAADGTVLLYNQSGGVHLIADLQGAFVDPAQGGDPFMTTTPSRLIDTRDGTGGYKGNLGAGSTLRVRVPGVGGSAGTRHAVLVNVTAANTLVGGYLTAYADGASQPGTSILNFPAGSAVPGLALVPLSPEGYFDISIPVGLADIVVDLQGYVA